MAMKKTILILDDREMFLYIARSHLTPRGYNVLIAQDQSQFISFIDRKIDLVLLDVNLGPEGNEGIVLLCLLQAKKPTLPIIMVSSEIEKRQACLDLGANYFFTKPVNYNDLCRHIDFILRGPARKV